MNDPKTLAPEIIEESEIHRGWLHIVKRRIKHPNGGIEEYEIVNPRSRSVCAVAFDKENRVILVELYRFGQEQRLRELPAGGIEKGETLIDAIRRELLEETGCAGDLTEVGSHFIAAEHGVRRHVFVARNCVQIAEPTFERSEVNEGATVLKVSVEEFKKIVRAGSLTETAAAFMALDYLRLL